MIKRLSREWILISAASVFAVGIIYWMSFRSPIIVDFGVLIDRSYRIFMGQVPCRDFYCPSTPLTFLIQSFIFKVFSPEVFWMKVYLALQMGLLLLMAGWFSLNVLKADFKKLLILMPLFLVWLPGIHLMIPWYDVDSVFFIFLTLCALCLAYRSQGLSRQSLFLFIAGAASGLSFLAKQNVGGACVLAGLSFLLFQQAKIKEKVIHLAVYVGGIAVPHILMAAYFIYHDALRDAVDWIFLRAAQRYGEGQLIPEMVDSLLRILFGPVNNFLKVILVFYAWALVSTGIERWRNLPGSGIRFGTAVFSVVAMGITILHFHGLYYPIHQIYLGVICGIILTTPSGPFGFLPENLRKPGMAFLIFSFLVMIGWGGSMRWRQAYSPSDIRWTLEDHPRLKGMNFRREDYETMKGLVDFEKSIPKDERLFIMPDPLFFYFATGRLSPVPMTHFLVSGYELNEEEQALIPGMLEKEDVKWVIIGKESYFDTGLLRFDLEGDWKTAVRENKAMMSRSDYSDLRTFIDNNYKEVPGPKGFWILKRKS